ncbi:hypothetical protein pb186bvf_018277 [Paramecium bursaria]
MILFLCLSPIIALEMIDNLKEQIRELIIEDEISTDYQQYISIEIWTYYAPMINYRDALRDAHEFQCNSIMEIKTFDNHTLLMYNQYLDQQLEHQISIRPLEEEFYKKISFLQENYYSVWILLKIDHRIFSHQTSINIFNSKTQTTQLVANYEQRIFYNKFNYVVLRKFDSKSGYFRGSINYKSQFYNNQDFGLIKNQQQMTYYCFHSDQIQQFFIEDMVCGQYSISLWFNIKSLQGKYRLIRFYASELNILQASIILKHNGNLKMKAKFLNYNQMEKFVEEVFINFDKWTHFQYIYHNNQVHILMVQDDLKILKKYENIFLTTPANYLVMVSDQQSMHSNISVVNNQFNHDIMKLDDLITTSCHFTCLQCNGPYEQNCTDCSMENNRYFINNQCLCQQGYIDINLGPCYILNSYIEIKEIVIYKLTNFIDNQVQNNYIEENEKLIPQKYISNCIPNCQECDRQTCTKCNHDYYLGIDGVNCLQCSIKDCQICYQIDEGNQEYNTINLNYAKTNEHTQTHCALCDYGYVYNYQNQICQKQFDKQCLHYYDESNTLICFSYQKRADYDYFKYFSSLLSKKYSIQLDDKIKQFLENNQQLQIDNYDSQCPNYCQTCSPRTQKQIYDYNPYFIISRDQYYQTLLCDQLNLNDSSVTYLQNYQVFQVCKQKDCIKRISFNMDCDRLCQNNKYHLQNKMDLQYILNNQFMQLNLNYNLINSDQDSQLQTSQFRNPKGKIFMIKQYNLLLDGGRFNIDYKFFNQEICGFNSIILQNFVSQSPISFNLSIAALDGVSFNLRDNSYLIDDSFNLRVFNATRIEIQNLTIQCINGQQQMISFYGQSRAVTFKVSIQQLTLRNCNLIDGTMTQFINHQNNTNISIQQLNIFDCKLTNFSISKSIATINVVNLSMVNTILKNTILFKESNQITFTNINIVNCKFYQSLILIITNNITIDKLFLSQSYLDSPIIMNDQEFNDLEILEIQIKISNSIIQYIEAKGFISLKQQKFKLVLDNLDLKGIDSKESLFIIETGKLIIKNSSFEKYSLTNEFDLKGLDYFNIDNVQLNGNFESSFLQLINVKIIEITNFNVYQVIQFKQPLIQYIFNINETSTFTYANSLFKDNQIFIMGPDPQISDTFMNFSNINQGEFYFKNISFIHNIIRHPLAKFENYGYFDGKIQQLNGGLLNFQSFNSIINFEQMIVQQFISIVLFFPSIVIDAQQITIIDSIFDNVNLNYRQERSVINGGIIKMSIEKLFVSNSIFQDASSNSGSALNIITKNEGFINITSSQFMRMKSTFKLPFNSNGGSIKIDAKNSSLYLILKDIYIKNSTAPEHGGFMYCQASNSYVLIENVIAFDIYSFTSSFLRFNSFNNQSIINLRNISIINSEQGYDNLMRQLIFHPNTDDNGIISIKAQVIEVTNFSFSGFSQDSVLDLKVISRLELTNIKIDKSQLYLSQGVCIKNQDQINSTIQIRIDNLIIKNIEIKEYSLHQQKNNNRILLYQNNQDRILNSFIFHIGFNQNQVDFIAKDIIFLNNQCIFCKKGLINIENVNNRSKYQFLNSIFINNTGIQQSFMYINGLLYIQMIDSLFLRNNNKSFGNPDLKFIKNIEYNYGNEYLSQVEFLELKPYILFIDQQQQYIQGNVNVMNSLKTVVDFREKYQADSIKLVFNENKFKTMTIKQEEIKLEQTLVKPFKIYGTSYLQDFILLPTLSQNQYSYFDPTRQQYYPYDLNFILVILDKTGNQAEINNTQILYLKTSVYDNDKNITIQNGDQLKLYYNEHLRGFKLNQLNITFSPYNPSNLVYQLNIQCDCINKNYEHILRVRTFPCNPGEYFKSQVCNRCEDQFGRYSLVANSSICQTINNFIDNHTNNQISLKKGYWRINNMSSNIIQCNQIIDKCIGGWSGGDQSCQIGYLGPLCEECDTLNFLGQGQFFKKNEKCNLCSNTSAWLIKFLLLGLWILISTFITVKTTLAQNSQFLSYQLLYKQYDILYRLNQDQSGSVMKIAINNLQIISTLQLMNIQSFYGYENPLNFLGNPMQMMGSNIECFLTKELNVNQHIFQLILLSISPLFFISMFQAFYLIYVYIFKISYQKHITIIATSSFYLFIYLQPDIMRELLSYISFRQISGVYWVAGNLKYKYFSDQNIQQVVTFIGPTSFLYIITIPLLLFYLLKKIKDRLQDKQSRNKFSYLYNEYRNNSYFWEIFKIFQRQTIIIIIVVLSKDYLSFKIQLLTILMYIFVQKLYTLKPYNQGQLNQFEIRNKQLILLIFQTSSIIYSFEENSNDQLLLICFILLIFFLILLLYYHTPYFLNFQELKSSFTRIEQWQSNKYLRNKRLSLLTSELKQYLQTRGKLISKIKSNIEYQLIRQQKRIIKILLDLGITKQQHLDHRLQEESLFIYDISIPLQKLYFKITNS